MNDPRSIQLADLKAQLEASIALEAAKDKLRAAQSVADLVDTWFTDCELWSGEGRDQLRDEYLSRLRHFGVATE